MIMYATQGGQKPVDKVIEYIKNEIDEQRVAPGDRLISERKLGELLGVGRAHVREAIQKMEFYGIVKTYPQSGTVVTEFSKEQMEKLFADTLKVSKYDFADLVSVRVLLETEACRLAVHNKTPKDIERVKRAICEFEKCIDTEQRVEKDFQFHRAVIQCSHNEVLESLLVIITPDIMNYYLKYRACSVQDTQVMEEHREYLKYIIENKPEKMQELELRHLANMIDFANEVKERQAKKTP